MIEYLSHPNPNINANAAAYLQHLCFMDNSVKSRTRDLGGIPALVELVKSDIPEVHRAACGALRNLSYGRVNDDNKVGSLSYRRVSRVLVVLLFCTFSTNVPKKTLYPHGEVVGVHLCDVVCYLAARWRSRTRAAFRRSSSCWSRHVTTTSRS